MTEEKLYRGLWWLPGRLDRKIPGVLKVSLNEDYILDLDNVITTDSKESVNPSIIHGVADGEHFTLEKCMLWGGGNITVPYSDGGFRRTVISSQYRVSTVYMGARFEKQEDIKFKDVIVDFSHFDEWVCYSGFEKSRLPLEGRSVEIKYTEPEPIPMGKYNSFKFYIYITATWPAGVINHVTIKQETRLKIESDEEVGIDDFIAVIMKFQNLLSLAVTVPVFPISVVGKTEYNRREKNGGIAYPPVAIFDPIWHRKREDEHLSQHNMFFTYDMVKDKINDIVKNWFGKYEEFEHIYGFYFTSIYGGYLTIKNRFLNLVQAIEGYHRLTHDNYEIESAKHRERVDRILNFIPDRDTDKTWLIKKVKPDDRYERSNEKSLRKRLNEVIEESAVVSETFFPKSDERDKFVSKVVETRNVLSHADKSLAMKDFGDLYELTYSQLQPLVEICLLQNLGFLHHEIKRFMKRHRIYGSRFKD